MVLIESDITYPVVRLGRYVRMGLHEGSQTGGNPRDDHHRNRSHHKRREGHMEIVKNLVKTSLGEVEKALSTKTAESP